MNKLECFVIKEGRVWVAAAHRVVMDTLCVRLGLIRGLTLLSRHHSPSLSIVVEFKARLKTRYLSCGLFANSEHGPIS